MNKQKVTPNISSTRVEPTNNGKRVVFEKEVNEDMEGSAVCVPVNLLTAVPLKTAMKASEHEEKRKAHAAPISQRRRVKSMPAGSTASNDFFGINFAPARKTLLEPLEVLNEDRAVGEGKVQSSNVVPKTLTKTVESTTISSNSQICPNLVGAALDVNNKQPPTNIPPEKKKKTASNCSCIIM
jgi:hypothetical protein